MKDTIKNLQNEILKRQEAIAVFETEIEASGSINEGIRKNIQEVKAANMREVLGCIPEGVTIRESDGRFEFLKKSDGNVSATTAYVVQQRHIKNP